MNGRFFVGEWLVEPEQNRIVRGEERVKLDPKAVRVLAFLAEHPREILTKEQIIGAVWDGAFVSDEVLTTAVWGLRKALGDDAKEPRYIKTIPRQGYQLIAPVEGASVESVRDWEPSPYPGLSAFGPRDADFFFGREEELDALWGKLQRQHLVGLIGPSGAGKSSLVRAGLLPRAPEGWEVLLWRPRNDAFERLTAALDDWRSQKGNVLWIVDQFEELFTLNDPETQAQFAGLLGAAAEEGVHVLLSMRDDFLMRCHDHRELTPVFRDLTPIKALEGVALRKALVEPARACGYRFEDDVLVAEILSEVTKERGALPLLAFAASRLWEKRDREKRLLTREAYLSIAGVSGALAQHAERTMSGIGAEHQPIVREIFRNLTTASGTRVPMNRAELLSVFPEPGRAEQVLGKLVDERLLTSSENEVEIIHESLLTAWPRLVRWQAQDAEGAVLRDQLRQSARLWDERGRVDDLLWTGTAFRDFAIWRERYSGALSKTEVAFAQAAAKLAGRRRRQKKIIAGAILAASVAVAAVTFSLWRRSEAETGRAEASKLLALGQLEMERNPTGALAYALKSVELADTEEARKFALQVLQQGPVGRRTRGFLIGDAFETMLDVASVAFSPNGEWVAIGGYRKVHLRHRDGLEPIVLQGEYPASGHRPMDVGFAPDGRTLVTNLWGDVRLWSVPDGRAIRETQQEIGESGLFVRGTGFITSTTVGEDKVVRVWPFGEGDSRLVGSTRARGAVDVDSEGKSMAYALGQMIYTRSLLHWDSGPKFLAEHPSEVLSVAYHPDGKHLAASDASGGIRIWSTADASGGPIRVLEGKERTEGLRYSPGAKWLFGGGQENGLWIILLWDLTAPMGSAPLKLRTDSLFLSDIEFTDDERWLVTAHSGQQHIFLWPFTQDYPSVLQGHRARVEDVAFTPDGSTLLSSSADGTLRAWPVDPESGLQPRVLVSTEMNFPQIEVDPSGTQVVVSAAGGRVLVVPLEGGPARELEGFSKEASMTAVAISPDGRLVAAAPDAAPAVDRVIRVWDIENGAQKTVVRGSVGDKGLVFIDRDHLLAGRILDPEPGLALFDLGSGERKDLPKMYAESVALSRTGRFGFAAGYQLVRFSFDGDEPTPVLTHGPAMTVAIDWQERLLATGGSDGVVRVGPVSGSEPYHLFGHRGIVRAVSFSPDGRWLASAGEDRTIRLWPVPDVTKTPLHKRSREELLATLRSWTNVRAVADEKSSTGWSLQVGPFPGWAKLPTLN